MSTFKPNFDRSPAALSPVFAPSGKPMAGNDVELFVSRRAPFDRRAFDLAVARNSAKNTSAMGIKMSKTLSAIRASIARGDIAGTSDLGAQLITGYRACEERLLRSESFSSEARSLAKIIKSSAQQMVELKGQALSPALTKAIGQCTEGVLSAVETRKSNTDYRNASAMSM